MTISNQMTVVALLNGMIGGIILVMPIMAVNTGYLLIAPVSLVMGFFSYFSCLLCLRHLKQFQDLDEAILYHFKKRFFKIFYDLSIVISMSVLLVLYFDLICEQWESMLAQSKLIPIINAIVLFPIVYLMRKFDFGATLLGYGILSIIGYCIFLVWMYLTSPAGQKQIKPAEQGFSELAAALGQGFAIQTFFIPVLMKNGNLRLRKTLLFLTYIFGIFIYTYIGYAGSFGIINRKFIPIEGQDRTEAETVEDFFGRGQWQVITLQIIYLVHLYSAFPQFLLVSMKRFFSVMKWEAKQAVSIKEVLFVSVTIFISLAFRLIGISVEHLIQFNGAFISFIFIYLIPIGLHIKCTYFSTETPHIVMTDEQVKQQVKSDKEIELESQKKIAGQQVKTDIESVKSKIQVKKITPQNNENIDIPCDCIYENRWQQYGQWIIMTLMVLSGLFIMGQTLYSWVQ